ncbi:class I SAM-dependent methyltransferase [Candidatus Woesearchaeota archaeon]|nr:class I SAM-dependent methyltransferase [Candidatus Woesearchaeota archaeon]
MPQIYSATNEAVLRNIPSEAVILDVGCGSGYLSNLLKHKKNIVYGVDFSEEAVKYALQRIDYAKIMDVETDALPFNKKFDVIIFADILEHLKHPEQVIKKFLDYLKPGGKIIISLPNIANWTIRIKLFFGVFNRTEPGILDKTHLHFYMSKTAMTHAVDFSL